MSRLVAGIVKHTKQKIITGTVIDVLGGFCTVRLSGRGLALHGLKFVGAAPSKGDTVIVDYRGGTPVVHANTGNLDEKLDQLRQELTAQSDSTVMIPSSPPDTSPENDTIRRFVDTVDPTATDDEDSGYEMGDIWINGTDGEVFILLDPTAAAADWFELTAAGGTTDVGDEIHSAGASAVTDSDEFGFWEDTAGILKNITWANIKATLKTYFDTLYATVSHNHDSAYTAHSLATAANDFLVASGAGTFVKKTLAETVTILRTSLDTIFAPVVHDHGYSTTIGTFLDGVAVPASTTYFSAPWKPTANATGNNVPWPDGGVLSELTLKVSGTQPAGGSMVVTLYINNAATALTVTLVNADGAGATKIDTTHTVNLVSGDLVQWRFQNNAGGGASAALTSIAMKLTKDTD